MKYILSDIDSSTVQLFGNENSDDNDPSLFSDDRWHTDAIKSEMINKIALVGSLEKLNIGLNPEYSSQVYADLEVIVNDTIKARSYLLFHYKPYIDNSNHGDLELEVCIYSRNYDLSETTTHVNYNLLSKILDIDIYKCEMKIIYKLYNLLYIINKILDIEINNLLLSKLCDNKENNLDRKDVSFTSSKETKNYMMLFYNKANELFPDMLYGINLKYKG